MNIIYIKKQDALISNWSQGETRQYFIYPETAEYKDKNFIFRLSSASIDSVPATFTKFNNYTRFLAMLDQDLALTINQQKKHGKVLDIVEFQSDDDVISMSRGNDFNLMVNNAKAKGQVIKGLYLTSEADFIIIFSLNDGCVVNKEHIINQYETLIIKNDKKLVIECSSECLISEITLHNKNR